MARSGNTFGQKLLSITYDPKDLTRKKLAFQYFLTIFTKYVTDVSAIRFTSLERFQNSLRLLDLISRILFIINFFWFLKTGKKPTLVDYILRLDSISVTGNRKRNLGYNYMTRELMWTGFIVSLSLYIENMHIFILYLNYRSFWE